MYKRIAARSALVLALVVSSIAVLASPALAFTKSTDCFANTLGTGQYVEFKADNGSVLGRVTWYWSWRDKTSRYWADIYDAKTNDGADFSVRVDFGSQVIEYPYDKFIGAAVVKYRVVWNGHASSWYPPGYCNPIAP